MKTLHWKYQRAGYLAAAGGGLGLALAPFMVIIKYMTGWSIIPQPFWVEPVREPWWNAPAD